MNKPWLFYLLIFMSIGLGLWLFNLLTYHFWLGGQNIPEKAFHVKWFYIFLVLFACNALIGVFSVVKLILISIQRSA